jgi:CRISPR-associated protein Cas5d
MKPENLVHLRVWGDFACFTRPEMKVERVSYPIITPSAARGVLEAVFWKPQMYYLIHQITVLRHTVGGREYGKGKWVSFRRNEVTQTMKTSVAQKWMNSPESFAPFQAGGGAADATQRNTLALADVAYLISAEVCLSNLARPPQDNLGKYRDEIRRRAQSGKCHSRPALGCREFAADFEWVEKVGDVTRFSWPEENLGLMLYDVFHPDDRQQGFAWFNTDQDYSELAWEPTLVTEAKGRGHFGQVSTPRACFFRANIKDAVMDCHPSTVEIRSTRGSSGYNAANNT